MQAACPGNIVPQFRALRILVADDNRDVVEALAAFLRLRGHDVRAAFDGRSAVGVAEELHPDACVLDVEMPVLTGHEVARHIRSMPWGQGMLLVAVSGWGQPADKRLAREAGFNHHFTKPADPEELSSALELREGGSIRA